MTNVSRVAALVGGALLCAVPVAAVCAQGEPAAVQTGDRGERADEAPAEQKIVAATVNGESIYAADVQREVDFALRDRPIDDDALPFMKAQTLERLISRRLALEYLTDRKMAASEQDVDLAVARLSRELERRGETLDDYYRRVGVDAATHRRELAWELSWRQFLEQYLTDENLQRYFERHQRQFDGSQLRIAHILLKVDLPENRDSVAAAKRRAQEIREEINSGALSFAEAAAKYSVAPTAKEGGDIGFIARHEPMPESFSRAAFELEDGKVSQPVVTSFGVHLITCLEIKPGQLTWQDVRPALHRAVNNYLFDWAADQRRGNARIEYTAAWPHVDAETGTVVAETGTVVEEE